MENNSTSSNSPPSAIASPPSPFPIAGTIVAVLCIVPLLFFVGLLAIGLLAILGIPIDPKHITVMQGLTVQFAAELALVPYLLLVMTRLWKRSLGDLGFRAPSGTQILIGIGGAIAMLALVQGLAAFEQLIAHTQHEQQAVQLLKAIRSPDTLVFFVLYGVFFAPIVEELTFRVFIFNAGMRLAPFWIAASVSGILFGLAHADIIAFLPLSVGGMLLCYLYFRTRNAWISMISHALFNGTTIVALLAAQHAGIK